MLVLFYFEFLLLPSLIWNIASFSSDCMSLMSLDLYYCCQSSVSACEFSYWARPSLHTQTFFFFLINQVLLMAWHFENLLTTLSGRTGSYVNWLFFMRSFAVGKVDSKTSKNPGLSFDWKMKGKFPNLSWPIIYHNKCFKDECF